MSDETGAFASSGLGGAHRVGSKPPAPVVAVGAVAISEGSLLLVRRANPPEPGRWSLPGGRVEAGESLARAVERETLEETGLRVTCGELRGWAERISPGFHYVILDFDVELLGPRVPSGGGDASAAAWVPLGQLESTDMVSGLRDFLSDHDVLG